MATTMHLSRSAGIFPVKSTLRLLIEHILLFGFIAGSSVYAVALHGVSCSDSNFLLPCLRLFTGIFFITAFFFGIGATISYSIIIVKSMIMNNDLNSSKFRDDLEKFTFFVVEVYVATLVLLLVKFVGITW
jgi:hypothetical protein